MDPDASRFRSSGGATEFRKWIAAEPCARKCPRRGARHGGRWRRRFAVPIFSDWHRRRWLPRLLHDRAADATSVAGPRRNPSQFQQHSYAMSSFQPFWHDVMKTNRTRDIRRAGMRTSRKPRESCARISRRSLHKGSEFARSLRNGKSSCGLCPSACALRLQNRLGKAGAARKMAAHKVTEQRRHFACQWFGPRRIQPTFVYPNTGADVQTRRTISRRILTLDRLDATRSIAGRGRVGGICSGVSAVRQRISQEENIHEFLAHRAIAVLAADDAAERRPQSRRLTCSRMRKWAIDRPLSGIVEKCAKHKIEDTSQRAL